MVDSSNPDSIRFYFSFRSPYAWLAAERLEAQLGDLGVSIERLPIYPTPDDRMHFLRSAVVRKSRVAS